MNISGLVDSQVGLSVTILAGQNGAGKSRYLQSLARYFSTRATPVIAVCNTPFDRFRPMPGVKRVSASRGRSLPLEVLKMAFVVALREGANAFGALSKTLNYCGYGPEIGVRVVGLDREAFRSSISAPEGDEFDRLTEELESALAYASDVAPDGIAWLDFSEKSFTSLRQQSYAILMKFEKLLRKMKVLRRIDLFIRRSDGNPIPLLEASSGELTLVSTLVYLSVEAREGCVVLIDEPENSLHPEWQKQYIERLLALLYYYQPSIYVATHAPVIVSGVQADMDVRSRIFHATPEGVVLLDAASRSVEGALWQVFQTVTPQNHYVSQTLSQALSRLASGDQGPEEVKDMIEKMREASYDPQQRRFFLAARQLAEKVAKGDDDEGDGNNMRTSHE